MHIGSLFFHYLAQIRDLVCRALAGVLLLKQKQRFLRKRRAILPDQINQILRHVQRPLLFLRNGEKLSAPASVHHSAVKSDATALRQFFFNEFIHGRHTLFPHAVERHGTSGKLLFRLHEIASVCPQSCLCQGNDRRACRSGETGDKLSGFKMLPYIFGLMKIGGRYNINIDLPLFHLLAQCA